MGLSGGIIAGNGAFISEIRKLGTFIGASGMSPAFLETYVNAQDLYQLQRLNLQENINYIDNLFTKREGFTFNAAYPIIYFDDEAFLKKLLENKIIPTSFNYTTASGKLSRIVITANHTKEDMDKLLIQLNSCF